MQFESTQLIHRSRAGSASVEVAKLCVPHIGTRLVRNAPEEDEDDADTAQRRGDEIDPFGLNVSAIVQQGSPWKTRHDKFEDLIVMLMQHSGMSPSRPKANPGA